MSESPFATRGTIEGVYGTFYTPREREELVRWLGRHGFNLYVYGPKNDRHHRRTWREPYPAQFMGEFARVVAAGREAGVAVCYALSPSAGLVHSSAEDFAAITGKLHAFYDIGVRAFSGLTGIGECLRIGLAPWSELQRVADAAEEIWP